jgi:hypothetical protein
MRINEALAGTGNPAEIFKIIKLLLFSAVTGPENGSFIQTITMMDAPVQRELMQGIEEMRQAFATAGVTPITPVRSRDCRALSTSPLSRRSSPLAKAPSTPDGRLVAENKQLREKLEETRVHLDEASTLYDELLAELKWKNPKIDQLEFRVREAEGATTRLKQVEDEVEELRGAEVKYSLLVTRYQEAVEKLDGVKAIKSEVAKLRKENEALATTAREATENGGTLNARVTDYRVRLKTAEQQLDEANSSAARKSKEIERVSSQRDRLQEQLSVLKASVAVLRTELEEAQAQREIPAREPVEPELNQEQATLQRRNTELADAMENLVESHKQNISAMQDDLEDARALRVDLTSKITTVSLERDGRISELEFQLRQQEDDVSAERVNAQRAHTMLNKAEEFGREQTAVMRRLQQENDDLKASLSRRPQPQQRAASPPPVANPQKRYVSAAPWEHDVPAPAVLNDNTSMMDADRRAELERRNRMRPQHLRSDYTLEKQFDTADDVAADTTTAATTSTQVQTGYSAIEQTTFGNTLRSCKAAALAVVDAKQGFAMDVVFSPKKKVQRKMVKTETEHAVPKMPARLVAKMAAQKEAKAAAVAATTAALKAEKDKKKKTFRNANAGRLSDRLPSSPQRTAKVVKPKKQQHPLKKSLSTAATDLCKPVCTHGGQSIVQEAGIPVIQERFSPMTPELNSTHKKRFDSGVASRRKPLGPSLLQNAHGSPLVDYLSPAGTPARP